MTTADAASQIRHTLLVVAGRDAPAVARVAVATIGIEAAIRFDEMHVLTTLDGSRGFIRRLRLAPHRSRARKASPTGQVPPERRHVDLLRSPGGTPIEALEAIGDVRAVADQIGEWFARHRQGGQAITVALDGCVGWLAAVVYATLHTVAEPDDHLWCVAPAAGAIAAGRARGRTTATAYRGRAVQRIDVPLVPPGRDCRLGPSERFTALLARRTVERTYAQRPPELVVNLERHTLGIGHTTIRLKPAEMFWYASLLVLAPHALQPGTLRAMLTRDELGRIHLRSGDESNQPLDQLKKLAAVHRAVYPRRGDGFAETLWRGAHCRSVTTFVARTNKALRTALGEGSEPYQVNSSREQGGYRLRVERVRWRLVPDVSSKPTD